MKFVLVAVFAGLIALGAAIPQDKDIVSKDEHLQVHENKDFHVWYKQVLTLFKYVHQTTFQPEHLRIAEEYSIEHNTDNYTEVKAVEEFLKYYEHGMLPKDEVFSVFYDLHLKQAIALFKLFYYAKDFETFFQTAVWARYHLNQGLFLYSYSVALIHRHDTYKMVLPPIYEIYPYYFFNAEVIQKAQQFKEIWADSGIQEKKFTIYANYSGENFNLHPEQSMSYFTEDIGINAYYYYYNLYRPFWLNAEEFGINTFNRGEEYYYFYQQLVARYYLERLSNNFGEINFFDYDDAIETGYYPTLRYQNGLAFSQRPNWAKFAMYHYNYKQSITMKGSYPYSYYLVVDFERRIRDAIDSGFVYTEDGQKINLYEPQGFNLLGNIIEANPEGINTRYYGYLQIFARHLLGYSFQPLHEYKLAPSVLEHFETSLRDPAFWQLYKRIVLYLQTYKTNLPKYTKEELIFDGVKIHDIEIESLITYFERYNTDLTNVVYVNQHEYQHNNYEIYARQYRLNHKPFNYKINVVSEKSTASVVRVFIGPKFDEFNRFININENRLNFVEFDRFKYTLKTGENTIERNSRQIFYSQDRTTYKQLYEYTMTGVNYHDTEYVNHQATFPNRFLLPKGKVGGQTYQFYVIVTPFKDVPVKTQKVHTQEYESEVNKYPMVGLGVQYLDAYPLGYPFERPIDEFTFYVPNSYFKDVVIYHKEQEDVKYNVYDRVYDHQVPQNVYGGYHRDAVHDVYRNHMTQDYGYGYPRYGNNYNSYSPFHKRY